jgi:hypothetical protein
MRVKILVSQIYAEFQEDGKQGAVRREVGEIVDYPAWYAHSLVDSRYANIVLTFVEEIEDLAEVVPPDDVGIEATKKALELAEELGVDLSQIDGTGKDGKITIADVRWAAQEE